MTKHADLVKSWRLYYASWGYSTPEERVLARELASQGVQWMELEDFVEFLRWGLVMGCVGEGVWGGVWGEWGVMMGCVGGDDGGNCVYW